MHEEEEEYKLRGRERLSQNITAINNVCVCECLCEGLRLCVCVRARLRVCAYVNTCVLNYLDAAFSYLPIREGYCCYYCIYAVTSTNH